MSTSTATVETLTAKVRVLMVGNRQVTLSVYRQLDRVESPSLVSVFGRVRDSQDEPVGVVHVVGVGADGALVRSRFTRVTGSATCPTSVDGRVLGDSIKWQDAGGNAVAVTPLSGKTYHHIRVGNLPATVKGPFDGSTWAWVDAEHRGFWVDVARDELQWYEETKQNFSEAERLPLIVLAGLR